MSDNLSELIQAFVENQLSGFTYKKQIKDKIIKDPCWGMIKFSPFEMAIIDSPLVQRLRRIHQTGLAYLTYPSALHTRFEHSLGVVAVTTEIVRNLKFDPKVGPQSIKQEDLEKLRLAAILHDIGHAAFSHLSEQNIKENQMYKQSRKIFQENPPHNYQVDPKPHEFFTYLILKSDAFLGMFTKMCQLHHGGHKIRKPEKALDAIASMIIGLPPEGNFERFYLANIINGTFDADKIDYIARDSYFTGIALGAEISMLMHRLEVVKNEVHDEKKDKRISANTIAILYQGAVAYEQIALSKKSLSVNVYNHQKVMASHSVVKELIEMILSGDTKISGVSYTDPASFLNLNDWDVLSGSANSERATKLQKRITRRDLPKRALTVAEYTLEKESVPGLRKFYMKYNEDEGSTISNQISELAGIDKDCVYVCKPKIPEMREPVEGCCKHPSGEIKDLMPEFGGTVESYGLRRDVSYIYSIDCTVAQVQKAAKQVLSGEEYGALKFNSSAIPQV